MKRHLHVIAIAAVTSALASGAIQSLISAYAVQNELVPPVAGVFTGPAWSQKVGDAFRSLASCNKGPTAPANVGGAVVDGLCWIDDSASPWLQKRYVNGAWAVEGAYDPSTSSAIGAIGGGGTASIASAATVDLGSVPQANISITGTTGISSFGASAPVGAIKIIRFSAVLIITHSASLTVPGGYPLTTAANDRAIVTHLGSGNWEITQYTRDNGIPVDVSALGKPDFSFQEGTPALHVPGDGRALTRTSYPAYLAKVTRVQNGTRTSGNATIAAVADTSKMGVGMPVEATGINAGCTIASLVANTSITLNSSACVTASGTSPITVFLTGYGSGGGATTVGVPNCSGAVLAGRETTATRLTASYFGGNSTAMATFAGSENVTMALANIFQHNHAVFLNDPGHAHSYSSPTFATNQINYGGGTQTGVPGSTAANTVSNTTGITVRDTAGGAGTANQTASTGSATPTPMRTVQPTLMADCNVRVIP
jgi:hypothetical protein